MIILCHYLNKISDQHFFQEPTDYDTWFDYLRMVEQEGDSDVIRDTYERAISNIPDSSGTVHKP